MSTPTVGIILFFSSLTYLAQGINITCYTESLTVTATLNAEDSQYFGWYMRVESGVNCTTTQLAGNETQTGSVTCSYLLGNYSITFSRNQEVSTSENDTISSSVYCSPTQSSLFGTGPGTGVVNVNNPPSIVSTEMTMMRSIIHEIPIEITMNIMKTSSLAVGEYQQVIVSLTEFSRDFARMILTLRINNGVDFYDIVYRGCVNTPSQSDVPFNTTGDPSNAAPHTITVDFLMVLPAPLIPNGDFFAPITLTITAIAELCPEQSFGDCFLPGDCADGSDRLGRRKKRSTSPIAVVRDTMVVFPNAETRDNLMNDIVEEESKKSEVYMIDDNRYCLDEGLFIAVVVLLALGVLVALIIFLFLVIKYIMSKMKSGSSTTGSTLSKKILPRDRHASGSNQDDRPRNSSLADDLSREYVNPRVNYYRDHFNSRETSSVGSRGSPRGSRV